MTEPVAFRRRRRRSSDDEIPRELRDWFSGAIPPEPQPWAALLPGTGDRLFEYWAAYVKGRSDAAIVCTAYSWGEIASSADSAIRRYPSWLK